MASLRAPRNPRNRQRTRPQNPHASGQPQVTWTATVAANVVTMLFNRPILVQPGVIPAITDEGVLPTAGPTVVSPTHITLPYLAAVSTDMLVVPADVQGIIGAMGGRIAAGSQELP